MSGALPEQAGPAGGQVFAATPLSLPGWLEFNRRKWGATPHRELLTTEGKPLPAVEAVFYTNKRGKLVMPRLSPYLPVEFRPTATDALPRLGRQWLSVGGLLAERWRKLGLAGTISLHPGIVDVRPFQWRGLRASVRYTFQLPFPFDLMAADKDVRRRSKNAQDAGFTCALSTDMTQAISCLVETESRQEFDCRLTVDDLRLALDLLGSDHFRTYVCYGPRMRPVSTLIVVHCPGCWAVGLVAGTARDSLSSGATQLMYRFALYDLQAAGAIGFDFAGANLPLISAFKLQWGGRLVPIYGVEQYGLRSTARFAFEWYKAARLRRTEPLIRVACTASYAPERQYILEVLLREFLGLDYRVETEDRTDWRLSLDEQPGGGSIHIPDVLFRLPAGSG